MEWEPKLRTRYVGILMNVLGCRFRDDIPTAGSIREDRTRLREPINKDRRRRHQDRSDDVGDGGHASQRAPHPEQRQDHKLDTNARGDSRDHANTAVHRQSTNANAARSESEEQGQWQRKEGRKQGKGCKERIAQERKQRRSENVLSAATSQAM